MMQHPLWCLGMLGTKRHTFRNIVGHVDGDHDLASLSAWTASQFDPTLSWADMAWVKKRFGGPVIVKGRSRSRTTPSQRSTTVPTR
jgi:L-lactate dehydrogenase (cytochrome)